MKEGTRDQRTQNLCVLRTLLLTPALLDPLPFTQLWATSPSHLPQKSPQRPPQLRNNGRLPHGTLTSSPAPASRGRLVPRL